MILWESSVTLFVSEVLWTAHNLLISWERIRGIILRSGPCNKSQECCVQTPMWAGTQIWDPRVTHVAIITEASLSTANTKRRQKLGSETGKYCDKNARKLRARRGDKELSVKSDKTDIVSRLSSDGERPQSGCIPSTPTWSWSWCRCSCSCRACCSRPWPTDPRRSQRSGGSGQRGSINQVSFSIQWEAWVGSRCEF